MRRMTLGALVAASVLTLAACADEGGGGDDPGAIGSPPIEDPLDASPAVDVGASPAVTPAADAGESPAAEEGTPAAEAPEEEAPEAEASPA